MPFATADICDLYGDRAQIVLPVLHPYGGVKRCFGKIRTIRLDEDNRGLVSMLKNEKGKGGIVVVDAGGDYCAIVGERLMGFAKDNGWAAIVVNGYVRDVVETGKIAVGLWALGTCPMRSTKRAPAIRDIPLEFAGVVFRPGEYLYADHDGMVLIPDNTVNISD